MNLKWVVCWVVSLFLKNEICTQPVINEKPNQIGIIIFKEEKN
jgi:hypothetical protein